MAVDYAVQSAYSDPGRWAELLDEVPTEPSGLSKVAWNAIAHYRAEAARLPEETRDEIGLRWLAEILSADQGRNPPSLLVDRPLASRVQGCCRDHTLLCVGALRHRGLEARSRVGFAGVDAVAALLVAADAGDEAAEAELHERYRADARLHPGHSVLSFSPNGEPASVSLARPPTSVL